MSEVGMPVVCERENHDSDRLSYLPESIIHYIFSFLDVVDVIRASAVSRKWRNLWVSVPYLDFNFHAFSSVKGRRLSSQSVDEKFKDFINWVLMNHSADIQRLCIFNSNKCNDYPLDRWITMIAQRNVQELDLFMHTPIELPHSLIVNKSLVSLKINTHLCFLRLPSLEGFSWLKSLHLQGVRLLGDTLFQNFISSCPLLENLKMEICTFHDFKILDISAIRLKNLTIGVLNPDGDMNNFEIKVACSSLESFDYEGPLAQDFSFQNLNSLQKVNIELLSSTGHIMFNEHYVMRKLLKGLQSTEVLSLWSTIPQYFYVLATPKSFSTPFYNLKSLTLIFEVDFKLDGNMLPVINLLNCSPNLEALTIFSYWVGTGNFSDMESSDSDDYLSNEPLSQALLDRALPDKPITCLTCNVKKIEVLDIFDELGIELVKFLLKHGNVLQKMHIRLRQEETPRPSEVVTAEIMQFPRSSPNVVLTIS